MLCKGAIMYNLFWRSTQNTKLMDGICVILGDNFPIFSTCVHLDMENRSPQNEFPTLFHKKSILLAQKSFCYASAKNMDQNGTTVIFTKSRPCEVTN